VDREILLQEENTRMRRRSVKGWILLAVIMLLIAIPVAVLVARSIPPSPDPLCSKPDNANGIIESIDRIADDGLVKLYDPTQKTFPPALGRVSLLVTVDASTRIFRQQGTVCQVLRRVAFRDLIPIRNLW
jgi:hypothetical protein